MNENDLHDRIQQIQDETGLDELTAAKIASAQLEQERRPQRPMAKIGPRDLQLPPADAPPSPATSTTTTDSPCAWCDGAGFYKEAVPYGHPNFGKLLPCACKLAADSARQQGRHDQLLAQLAGELGALAHCRLTNYSIGDETPLQEALVSAQRYGTKLSGWLYLWGSCGTGKSHLAAALAHEAARRGMHASYASVPALLRFIKAGFKDDTSDDRMAALQQVGFLVLDDIGAEYHTRAGDFNATALFEIVNYRDLRDLPTVFTSNIRCDELESRISSRIYGRAQRIRMVGSDYRKRLRS